MPSAQTALMPLRRRLNAFICAVPCADRNPYRPELYYMRGMSLGTGNNA
jgi:hypothetical protein